MSVIAAFGIMLTLLYVLVVGFVFNNVPGKLDKYFLILGIISIVIALISTIQG